MKGLSRSCQAPTADDTPSIRRPPPCGDPPIGRDSASPRQCRTPRSTEAEPPCPVVEPARGILLPVSASHPDPDTFCGWICAGSSFPHTTTKGVGGDYLPWEVPLLKPVAAVAGSDVCAQGARLFIDGQAVAKRLGRDAMGRRMPWCPAAGGSEPGSRSCSMPDIRPRWSRRAIGFCRTDSPIMVALISSKPTLWVIAAALCQSCP